MYLVFANMYSKIFSDSDGVSEVMVLSLGATVKVVPSGGVLLSSDGPHISSHILHWIFRSVTLAYPDLRSRFAKFVITE